MEGRIHSLETFGTVDGPGARFVVFMQGCPLRCKYCHNPDTWDYNKGNKKSVEQILKEYGKVEKFLKNGGITVTGGEPLVQIDFVIELLAEVKRRGIHTCVDTSGITFHEKDEATVSKFLKLLDVTDLFLLDIKHIDDEMHKALTGRSNENVLDFAYFLNKHKKDVWIRHVVVPGWTYKEETLQALGYFLGGLDNVKALDVLAYHTMGVEKYKALGIDYPLAEINDLKKEDAIEARNIILKGMQMRRKGHRI